MPEVRGQSGRHVAPIGEQTSPVRLVGRHGDGGDTGIRGDGADFGPALPISKLLLTGCLT